MSTPCLSPDRTALVLIDVQEKLAALMHEREVLGDNLQRLIPGARVLGLPVLWLEQYPQGLGPTLPAVAALLPDLQPITKRCFSAWGSQTFRQQLTATGRPQVLLAGIETHVCVYQTALDLLAAGYAVWVVCDAVASRTPANHRLGLERMREAGARWTSVEMALFEMLRTADAPAFKEIARLIK